MFECLTLNIWLTFSVVDKGKKLKQNKAKMYNLCTVEQYICWWIYIYKGICLFVCPIYMSKNGTWSFPVSGNEIWDFLSLTNSPIQTGINHLKRKIRKERYACYPNGIMIYRYKWISLLNRCSWHVNKVLLFLIVASLKLTFNNMHTKKISFPDSWTNR